MKFKDIINDIKMDGRVFKIRVFKNGTFLTAEYYMGDIEEYPDQWQANYIKVLLYGDCDIIKFDTRKLIIDLESGDRG